MTLAISEKLNGQNKRLTGITMKPPALKLKIFIENFLSTLLKVQQLGLKIINGTLHNILLSKHICIKYVSR